ncbi:MAG: outer membrane protein assembly factor BamD [Bacteriovoracaceae bacterium]|nr:outer membrane protein assembly factor BamD [Bacteriovoracaceae bacterium]
MKFLNIALLVLFISCATEKPEGKTEAEVLFKEASVMMEEGRYLLATEKLNQLKNQYPYSFYATPAELMQADILYKQENYVEAAAAYLLFKDFHPKHQKTPYVVYRIAESYYQQIPETHDRDLQPAYEAIRYYKELIQRFPKTSYVKEATTKIKDAEDMIRMKEKYIADFYYKTEVFEAARWRYLNILENFQNTDLLKHSMKRVIISSYKLKEYDKCGAYAQKFAPSLPKSDEVLKNTVKNCLEKLKK